jgi:hypothetical protein
MIEGERLVFVGGLHRSGTTPLADALAQHPDISGLSGTGTPHDEGQHLQPVYPRAKVYAGSGHFAYAPEAHLTESSPLVTPENAARMLSAWQPYWDLDRRLLLEKSPPNLIMGRFLQALYPGSALVMVVRHPVVVALCNKKWRRLVSRNIRRYSTLDGLVAHWVQAHRLLLEDTPHLQRLHLVRYEDLVERPEEELARIQSHLGLSTPFPTGTIRPSHSERYEQQWDSMRTGLTPGAFQRRLITRRHAADIAAFGYDVDDLGVRGDWPQTPAGSPAVGS